MTTQLSRLLVLMFLLINSAFASSNVSVKHQAQLAYLDLLIGNTRAAYRRIPQAIEKAIENGQNPTLSFAKHMLNYGQNKLAYSALERYTSLEIKTDIANSHWLDFAEAFLELGSVSSSEKSLVNITSPIKKKDRSRYYRLTADIALNKLNIDQAEYILNSKWKGRDLHKPYTRLNLATAYAYKGNFAAAHASINQLSKDIPKEIDTEEQEAIVDTALIRIGFAYLTSGNLEKAKAFLSKVPIKSIYAQRATLGLAWAEIGLGQYTEALSPLVHLIDNTQSHQIENQESFSLFALVASKQKKYGKAASLYLQSKDQYEKEIDALKRYAITVYSGKAITSLATHTKGDLNIDLMQEKLGNKLHYYLREVLEKDATKVLLNAYRQQSILLLELSQLSREINLSNDDYWRYQQALKKSIFKHKETLIKLFASEIENHVDRLEKMAAHAEFSAGLMYEKVSNLN